MIFARASEAMGAQQRHFRSLSCLDRLRDITRVKKTSHFPRQLDENFEALFKHERNLFWFKNLMAKC